MAEGTVRGAFDLDTGPAIRGVREYRREAAKADEQTQRLGQSIDDAFGVDERKRIDSVARSTRELGDQTARTRMVVRDQWRGMRRDVQREAAQISSTIAVVRDRMRALGRERVTPQIDLDGIAKALAQVELLDARLAALGGTRATPRVALGGGFGSAAARAAGGAAGGAGGRGGSGILSMGGVGFAGVRGGTLAAAAGVALPAVQSLLGATTAVAGSLTGGALGAGATGLAGGGVLAAGIAAVASVAKPANERLKDAVKAQEAYTEAIRQYGRASKEARAAGEELARMQSGEPGIRRAMAQRSAFGRDWRRLTRPGRQQWYGLQGDAAAIGRRVAPQLAGNANLATGAVRRSGTRQLRFLAGGQMQEDLGVFTRAFARELPTAERTLENVERSFVNIARAAIPFFHDANVWTRNWTWGWRTSTSDIEKTREGIRKNVESFKDWRDLSGSVFRTVRDLFRLGQPEGDSMVVHLTQTFDRWDAWINANPAKTRRFFRDTVNSTEDMAGALKSAVGWLNDMASILRPILDRFSQLVQLVSSLGLIGAPGAVAGLLGAYRGARGGAGGGSAAVMGGGMVGEMMAGGAGLVGARRGMAGGAAGTRAGGGFVMGPTYEDARRARIEARRVQAGMPARSPGAGGPLLLGGWLGARRPGRLGTYARNAAGMARGSRAAGALGGAARGAARGFLPVAAGLSALDFATFDGSFGERSQAALSSATLGLISRPRTAAERADAAGGAVGEFMDRRVSGLPATVAGGRRGVGMIDAEIARLQGQKRASGTARALGGGDASIFGVVSTGSGLTDEQFKENKKRIELLREEKEALRRTNAEMERQRGRELDDRSRQRAAQYGAGLGGAYRTYRRSGMAPGAAAEQTLGQVTDRLKVTRDAGVETLGEASLAWARALAKRHPEMKKQVDELTAAIERRFRRMGQNVKIVNGDILTGSRSEWRGIANAMSDPMEQARQKLHDDFTAIQRMAMGSLEAMGMSPGEARRIVQGMESGGAVGKSARSAWRGGSTAGLIDAQAKQPGTARHHYGKARGGMIGGRGLMDTVPVGDNALAAPGEAWIANRHTLSDLSRATVAMYGRTAQQMITGETRRHGQRFSTGGRRAGGMYPGVSGDTDFMPDLGRALSAMAGASGTAIYVQSGKRSIGEQAALFREKGAGNAAAPGPNAPHVRGIAADITPGRDRFGSLASRYGLAFTVGHEPWHVELAGARGGGARGGGGAGLAAMAGGSVQVSGVGIRQRGIAGVMRGRAGDIFAAGLQSKLNEALGGSGGDLSGFSGGGNAKSNMTLGHRMMLAAGWPESEWSSLRSLWQGESGWNQNARNATSGAFGIPQSLPASKMGAAAVGGDPAAQIRWGLGYIRGRYGSPSGALSAWQGRSPHWYARGGRMDWAGGFANGGSFTTNGPTAFVAGEGHRRRERVTVTPANVAGGRGGPHVAVTFAPGSIVVKADGRDAGALAEEVGELVAEKITQAIRSGASGVID